MKNLILIFTLMISVTSFSQSFVPVAQKVTHGNLSTAQNGCVSVKLVVDYTENGIPYSSSSSTVALNKNNSITLNANIPNKKSVIVTSKRVIVYCTNGQYIYTMSNSVYNNIINFSSSYCNGTISNAIYLQETVSPSEFLFELTSTIGG